MTEFQTGQQSVPGEGLNRQSERPGVCTAENVDGNESDDSAALSFIRDYPRSSSIELACHTGPDLAFE